MRYCDKNTTVNAYFLYIEKYRKVCVIMMPYKTMLNTTPTKMGPYLR